MDNTKTKTFGDNNQYTYKIDASGNPYGNPINVPSNANTVDASKLNGSNITTPTIPSPTYGGLPGAIESTIKNSNIPAGWDLITYNNFKKANPNLEPDAEDTTRMLNAGKPQDQINLEALKTRTDISAADYLKSVKEGGDVSNVDYSQVDTTKKEKNRLTASLMDEQLSNRRMVESLQKNNPEGLGTVGLGSKINDINRESLSKQADIALLKFVADNDYQGAVDIANRQVQLKTEKNKAETEALKTFYEMNKADFTKAEDRAYQEKISEKERIDKKQDDLENQIKDIKLEAAKNNAPVSVIMELSKIDTTKPGAFDEALKKVGNYLGDNQVIKLENGNTIMVNAQGKQIASFGGAKTEEKNNYSLTSQMVKENFNNDIVSVIANTIKSSGAKQSQSTNDAINVISGLQTLVKDNPSGEFVGINPIIRLPNKLSSQEALTNRSNIEAINLKVQQWASGAALTEDQTKKVEKMTPNIGDTDKQVKSKVNALANYMVSQVSGQLAGQGVGFSIDKIDMFTKPPEDELAEKYKDPEMKIKIQDAIKLYPNYSASEILQIINL